VADLVEALLKIESTPETLNLVAEDRDTLIGHVAFSPVQSCTSPELRGYLLAPLAVLPNAQRHGVGTALVRHGLQWLATRHVAVVFVYGDPRYYGRFGFNQRLATRYSPPYPLDYPEAWQAVSPLVKLETYSIRRTFPYSTS